MSCGPIRPIGRKKKPTHSKNWPWLLQDEATSLLFKQPEFETRVGSEAVDSVLIEVAVGHFAHHAVA